MTSKVSIVGVEGIPLIGPEDDIAGLLIAGMEAQGLAPAAGDIVVIAQKIVSKSEGRLLDLNSVEPSREARQLARETGKDPRQVEAILRESNAVVRSKSGVIIVEHRLGLVLANAGIDRSNIDGPGDTVLLLPEDPDASAAQLKDRFDAHWNCDLGVVIADSIGRAWRLGTIGTAIGAAGFAVLDDQRGARDLFERELEMTVTGHADAVAAAATLVMGEGAEAVPAALVRGANRAGSGQACDVIRPISEDLFR